jgi:hypothetical protein
MGSVHVGAQPPPGAQTAAAQAAPGAPAVSIDVSRLGPQVGDQVPEFSLRDQRGEVQTRDSIMGPNGAMLVFFRSADW